MLKPIFNQQEASPQFSKANMQDATGKDWEGWSLIIRSSMHPRDDFLSVIEHLVDDHHLSPAWARTIASYYLLENP